MREGKESHLVWKPREFQRFDKEIQRYSRERERERGKGRGKQGREERNVSETQTQQKIKKRGCCVWGGMEVGVGKDVYVLL